MQEKFTLFWNGPFSQWATSPFEFEGMKFDRAEQFMMFCKAMFFNDIDSAKAIMNTNDPSKQKKLGRKVKNFNVKTWSKVARDIVYIGSYCKFTQNESLFEDLERTDGTTLVEASPYDKVWGIGLSEDSPLALKRETWDGKNWLGEVLTEVRKDLLLSEIDHSGFKLCRDLVKKYNKK